MREGEKQRGRDLQRKTAAKCSKFQNSSPKCLPSTGGNTLPYKQCVCTSCTPCSGCSNEICKFLKALEKAKILHIFSRPNPGAAQRCVLISGFSSGCTRRRALGSTLLPRHPRGQRCDQRSCPCCAPPQKKKTSPGIKNQPHSTAVSCPKHSGVGGAARSGAAGGGPRGPQRHSQQLGCPAAAGMNGRSWVSRSVKSSHYCFPLQSYLHPIMDHIAPTAQRRLNCGISVPHRRMVCVQQASKQEKASTPCSPGLRLLGLKRFVHFKNVLYAFVALLCLHKG